MFMFCKYLIATAEEHSSDRIKDLNCQPTGKGYCQMATEKLRVLEIQRLSRWF